MKSDFLRNNSILSPSSIFDPRKSLGSDHLNQQKKNLKSNTQEISFSNFLDKKNP